NKLIEMDFLKENSIIRIDCVIVNSIEKNENITLMLYELEVIQSDSERIGNPGALSLTDITINNEVKNFPETINDNNTCLDCDAAYIGKTIRQASRRLKEHGAPLNENSVMTPTTSSQVQSNAASNTLRRSARNIGKMVDYRLLTSMTDENNENVDIENKSINVKNSALHQHAIEHQHKINWDEWKIITTDPNWYRLRVRESLHILEKQPELNKTVSSVPLIIYPEGLGGQKPKVKMKKYR
ncbi:unnamed protein product, partial [Rotaria sp. Silwood1]